MTKNVTRKTRRRVFFILIITITVFAAATSSIAKIWFQIIEKNNEQRFLEKELSKLQDEEQYLRVEVEKLNDPDYVARYAREKYLYSKDGEFTIRIP